MHMFEKALPIIIQNNDETRGTHYFNLLVH